MNGGTRAQPRGLRSWAVDIAIVLAATSSRLLIDHLQGLVHAGSDLVADLIPAFAWWWQRPRLLGGWNPWIFGGYPAGADPLFGQVHPLGLLYAVASPLTATEIDSVLTPALAALGMMLYLHAVGCGRFARLVGGLSFAMGGFMASQATHPPQMRAALAVPWALAAIEALDGKCLTIGLAAATAAIIASGHPQMISYALAVVAAYAAWLGRPFARGRAVALAAGFVLGAGLTAVTWLPAVPHILGSTRNVGVHPGADFEPLTLHDLLRLVVPFVDGGSTTALYGRSLGPSACTLFDCTGYPGMPVLLVVLGCLPVLLRDARGRFWLAIAVAGVVSATGALGPIPPVAGIRAIARLLVWWNVAVAAAAGLAIGRLDRGAIGLLSGRALAAALVLLGAAIAAAATSSPVGLRAALVSAPLLALTGIACAASRASRAWWLVAILALDLIAFSASLSIGIPLATYHEVKHSVHQLELAEPAAGAAALDRRLAFPFLVGADWASIERIPVLQGYGSLASTRYARLVGQNVAGRDSEVGLIADPSLAEPSSHVLDLLRCRIVVAFDEGLPYVAFAERVRAGDPRWERVAGPNEKGGRTYLNRRALPVAWLVHRARVAPDEQALQIVRGTSSGDPFEPTREALLAAPPPLELSDPPGGAADVAELVSYDEDEVRIRVRSAAPALLVTSDLADAGWAATLDGAASEILTANFAFRSVAVPAGAHEVVLRYRPGTARVGLAISLASLACVVGLALRRAQSAAAEATS